MKRYFWQKIMNKDKVRTAVLITSNKEEEYKVMSGEELLFSKEISREEAIRLCGEDAIGVMEERVEK